MQDSTLNLNAAECISSTSNWGQTVYYNICNGHKYSVPWGTMDYLGTILLICGVLLVMLVLLTIIIDIIRN